MEIVDLLITWFLGGLGIHRFMKKYTTSGIIWLCTGGLFGIGWLIDIIFVILDKELIMPK
jgi:TM2 domain-containing membrane protein YozV